jgi:hypothetical protein
MDCQRGDSLWSSRRVCYPDLRPPSQPPLNLLFRLVFTFSSFPLQSNACTATQQNELLDTTPKPLTAVDHNVQRPAQLARNSRNQLCDLILICQIANHDIGFPAVLLDLLLGCGVGVVSLDEDQICSCFGESESEAGTDTSGCACDPGRSAAGF